MAHCIDPALLMRSRTPAPRPQTPSNAFQRYTYGQTLNLPPTSPTPSAVLAGTYQPAAPQRIACLPRRSEFNNGPPTLTKTFTVHGHRAPYLNNILKGEVCLDRADELIMAEQGWSRTCWQLDWPCYILSRAQALDASTLTYKSMAIEIAIGIQRLLATERTKEEMYERANGSPWAARNVRFADIRIVAIHYYKSKRVWVPVLAFDVLGEA
ncbi:hypothetical protein C8F01DRAFT_1137464 [Mycena amicta]|nr:hypothetical protein C8F01DRAFT_1137464 [Mycena amicta]